MTNSTTQTSIVPQDTTSQISLKPIQSVEAIVDAYHEYNKLKQMLLTDNDYQIIRSKKYINKSGYRKLATAFGISIQVTKENRLNFENFFVYEISCKAIAPNGRFVECCASCSSNEKTFNHIENDVRATAQTRASNRAIADLIGGGEVSAEEIYQDTHETKQEDKNPPKNTSVPYHETPEGKKHYANMQNRFQKTITKTEDIKPEIVDTQNLEDSEPHMKGFVHKNNNTYETPELMTIKQKNYLIKLIEIRYQDEPTRASLFNRLKSLTKSEARDAIGKMLAY